MAAGDEIIAVFKADMDQFKAQLNELGIKIASVDKKIEDSNKKTKKGFKEVADSAKSLGTNIVDGLGNKFTQLGVRIAAAFTAQQIISFGKECVNSFREAEKAANQLSFAINNIANEGSKAFDVLIEQATKLQSISIFSDEQIQNAQTQLVQFGLTSRQVEKLIPQIIDLASAQGIDLSQATDKVIQGINGQTRGLRDAGIAFEDTGSKTENLSILTEKLAKFQGATAVALKTSSGEAKNLENQLDNLRESIGEKLNPVIGGLSLALFDTIASIVGADTAIDKIINKFTTSQGRIESYTQSYRKLTDAQLDAQEKFVKLDILEEGKKRDRATTEAQRDEINKRIVNIGDELKAIEKIKEERKRAADDQQKIRDDLTIKGQNDLNQANDNATKELEKAGKDRLELIRKQGEVARDELEKAEKEKQDLIRKTAEVAREELEKSQQDQLLLIRKTAEAAREELENKEKESRKNRIEKEQESRKRRIEDERRMLETIGNAYDNAFKRREDLIDKEIELQNKNIDIQRDLANRGLSNTLAFEEKRAAELRRQQEVEKERNRKIKLLETFLNALADFSKTDAKTALPRALTQVALATAASAVFAEEGGIIGDIKERSSLTRRHKSGKDVLLHAEVGEGIFSKREVDNIGKKNFYLLKEAARFPIRGDVFKMPKISIDTIKQKDNNESLISEIRDLKAVIKNKRESSAEINNAGEYITKLVEDGVTTITSKKLRTPKWRG